MIESEEKRQRLTDRIERWCKHTNHRNLRNGDIYALANSILEEFYHITLCCGHLVKDIDDGVLIEFYEYDDHSKGTVQGLYCKDCAEKYKKELGAWEIDNRNN